MTLIYIDGPQKAGKSTIISALRQLLTPTVVREWGPAEPDLAFSPALLDDCYNSNAHSVWKRGWAAEHIYATLLRRLPRDPWLGEWLYGRAFQTAGLRIIVLGPDAATLARLRDDTDLPIDPAEERGMFLHYASRFHYLTFMNEHMAEAAERAAAFIKTLAGDQAQQALRYGLWPPAYAGPTPSPRRVVFVGESAGKRGQAPIPGAFLPFTSRFTTMLARELGDFALQCGWTNLLTCAPWSLRGAGLVVACGEAAARWVQHHVSPPRMEVIPHPSWLYRFKNGKTAAQLKSTRITLADIRREFDDRQEEQV